jgi:oxygen-dependent protoporphyrinogen oxidase
VGSEVLKQKIQIVGGGFSGLVQAYYFVEAGYSVHMIEKEDRLGGLLGTHTAQGFTQEQAANAFIANSALESMARNIGVKLVSKKPEAKRRYIFKDGQMRRWPLSWGGSWPLVTFALLKKWNKKKYQPVEDQSLYSWGQKLLGPEATDYLLEPAMQGIFATTADQLDASLIVNSLFKPTQRGKLRGSVSPEKGMQEWIDKLRSYLKKKGVSFELNQEKTHFDWSQPTVLALGLKSLRELANEQKIPVHRSVLNTRCASLTSVVVNFKDPSQKISEGFGCLFPKKENFNSLGVLFNHSIFPGRVEEGASETWILNDQKMDFSAMSPMALLRYIQSDRSLLGKSWVEPDEVQISQWPERIPVYNNALKDFIKNQNQEESPFLLIGNYLGDLGLSKILFHAQKNVEKVDGGFFDDRN